MPFLNEEDAADVRGQFAEALAHDVKLLMFTQQHECAYCRETRELLEEIAALSDRLHLEVKDFQADADLAETHGIDKIPAIAVLRQDHGNEVDYGIRLYGIPSGYEFMSLLEAITLVGSGEHDLSPQTLQRLEKLDEPVHLQVFVTPTCPYCPRAVVLAHQLAFVSPLVRADMVEAIEFPHLSNKYGVMGVPRTVINEETHVEGAVPEPMLVARLPIVG